jgi:hypothetical protein
LALAGTFQFHQSPLIWLAPDLFGKHVSSLDDRTAFEVHMPIRAAHQLRFDCIVQQAQRPA